MQRQWGDSYRTNGVPTPRDTEVPYKASKTSLFFFLFKEKKKSNVTNEKKDILTCTLQSWYLLDVPVQVLLASPLTDFLLNKETTVRQGSETFPFAL